MEPKTILVADDSTVTQLLLNYILNQAGYRVHLFKDGQSVLDFLRENPADLLITDICMPGLDGLKLMQEMQQIESAQGMPVILVTGTVEQLAAAERANAGAVLSKPIGTWQVQEHVRRLLGDHH